MTQLGIPIAAMVLAALVAAAACAHFARRLVRHRRQMVAAAERYAAVIESASDAVLTIDRDQRIVVFNNAAERLLGCRRDEVLGTSLERFLPAAIRQRHAQWVAEFGRSSGDREEMPRGGRDVVALRADGREVPVEASISTLVEPGSQGRRKLYTVVLRDISRRKAAEAELFRVSERYRTIVEQSPDAIWLAEDGALRLLNPACVALLGARSADELIGRPLADFIALTAVGDAPGAGDAPTHGEARLRRVDGTEREVEFSLATVPDHTGPALQGVMRDITERKSAESELRRTQASLIDAQRIARLGYFGLDVGARRWSASPTLLELLGQPPGSTFPLVDGPDIVHPDDRAAVRAHLEAEVLTGRKPFDLEFRIVRGDNAEVRWLHAIGQPRCDAGGAVTHLFGSVQDVTERRLATEVLERQREELRRLSAALSDAREQERRRVARELHDELGQRLSALKLDLSTLLPQLQASADDVRERLRGLLREVDEAIAATRRIATDLRPAMLDDLGLSAAIDWLASDWARRASLKITVDCEPVDGLLDESAATAIYRIVQEGLTNVSRHAHATEVRVELRRRPPDLLLRIADDGRGLGAGDASGRPSNGLTGIRERARTLGGAASLRNRRSRGCVLEVRLPLERIDSRPGEMQEAA